MKMGGRDWTRKPVPELKPQLGVLKTNPNVSKAELEQVVNVITPLLENLNKRLAVVEDYHARRFLGRTASVGVDSGKKKVKRGRPKKSN